MPKAIHIVNQIPLTPVGKVFKPDLKRREVRYAAQVALAQAGLQPHALEAIEDPSRGMVIRAVMADDAEVGKARQALGFLPFGQEVVLRS